MRSSGLYPVRYKGLGLCGSLWCECNVPADKTVSFGGYNAQRTSPSAAARGGDEACFRITFGGSLVIIMIR